MGKDRRDPAQVLGNLEPTVDSTTYKLYSTLNDVSGLLKKLQRVILSDAFTFYRAQGLHQL